MRAKPIKLIRPTQYAEHHLIVSIMNGTYAPGATLPSERDLSEQLGITRPTLRETLQRLASEGWLTIQHGKSTIVNDIWREGGLGLLGTMAEHGELLPEDFIAQLMEVRTVILPICAKKCTNRAPNAIAEYLAKAPDEQSSPGDFADFDWGLQILVARESGNRIYPLILNDFTSIFIAQATLYFSVPRAREASMRFYRDLASARDGDEAARVVLGAMQESAVIWNELNVARTTKDTKNRGNP